MSDQSSMLDPSSLEMLRDLDPSGGLVGQVLDAFLDELPRQFAAIEGAQAIHDDEALRRAAHALKSSSGNVGAHQLAELLRRIEVAAASDTGEDFATLVAAVRNEIPNLTRAIREARTALTCDR